MIKGFKCRICDHVYIGMIAPDRCPFCGVDGKNIGSVSYLVDDVQIKEISKQTRSDLYKALRLEYEDAFHYKCASENSKCPIRKMMFDTLFDQEIRHAHIIEKILGIKEGSVTEPESGCIGITDYGSKDFNEKVFDISIPRERDAVVFYNKIAKETDDLRIKEIFYAIADAEYHHSLLGKLHN